MERECAASPIVGYRVLGREGELGRVVGAESLERPVHGTTIVVRGGVSDALVYYVPASRLVDVSHETATVRADVDIGDFVPSLGASGTVDLHLD